MTPKRVQRRRTRGWEMPDNTVYVGRPSRWGNPFSIEAVAARYPSLTTDQCRVFVVNEFKYDRARYPSYPSVAEIRTALVGYDLACWCPLDQTCHADVLLDIANGGEQ